MALRINDTVPDFTAQTDQGKITFHDWIGDSWAILFSHPKDFTPVCTTEFGAVAQLTDEWKKRNTKVIGISVDSAEDHRKWKGDIESYAGASAGFPIIADTDLEVSKAFDMLPAEAYLPDGRTPADTATVRAVFIVSPDKKLQLSMTYPMSVGRNFAEVLRALVDSPEFAAAAGQKVRDPGEDVVATYRALNIKVTDPPNTGGDDHAANAMLWQAGQIGLTPFTWPRPDGSPMDNVAWSSPSRMLSSFQVHYALAGSWYPKKGIRYKSRGSWVPRYPIRFDELVDYLSLRLLGRRSTSTLLQACCEVVGYRPSDRIVKGHRLVTWDMPFVLATILDSPDHLSR